MYVDAHANAMLEFKYKAGDIVAVWMPESPEKVIVSSKFKLFISYRIDENLIFNSM